VASVGGKCPRIHHSRGNQRSRLDAAPEKRL